MPALLVAAGGGGDAITATALAGTLGLVGRPVVMTFSWDRLMIDPLPGPRTRRDFDGLRSLTPTVSEIVATTRARAPAGSALPRLAAELPARILLLDPTGGAVGLAEQISDAAHHLRLEEIVLVDVGGDALTIGADDPGLRSPLADQLALAACVRTGLPTRLLIAGAGLDGELPAAVVTERLHALHSASLGSLTNSDAATIRHVFAWHPSEASGLLTAAAAGTHGTVEVRDAADHVVLDAATTALASVDAAHAIHHTPAQHLPDSHTLAEVEQIVRDTTGASEIDYETRKAATRTHRAVHQPAPQDLPRIDQHATAAGQRGADHISTRRLAELLHATTLDAYTALTELLATHRPGRYRPSLYRTR